MTGGRSNRLMMFPYRLNNVLYSRLFRFLFRHKFAAFGRGTNLVRLDGIEGAENISIGNDVLIAAHSYLAARPLERGRSASLSIGDGAKIGRNNHIYATSSIVIGPGVLTASNVYIADNGHSFEDPVLPIFEQPVVQLSPVSIGAGTWLGHGSAVIGARVGRNCVVGFGALVRHDVPDNCVVVGVPARIVKRFDFASFKWRRTDPDGSFNDLLP
jgi:acetyltransferase-like isoleucine patch superfamily enzyme